MKHKTSLARRRLLAMAAACAGAPIGSALAQQKPKPGLRIRTREEVGYRNEAYLGRTCSKCVLYQGDGKCVILSEPIDPNGWCTQWVPATMG